MTRKKMPRTTVALLWISGVLLVLLVVGALGFSSWVGQFLKSENFRRMVSDQAGRALGAEVELGPLQWTGPSVFAESFTATGHPDSPVVLLEGSQIRSVVDWRAAFDGVWSVESLDLLELHGVFGPVVPKAEAPEVETLRAKRGWLPQEFALGPVRVQRATLIYEDPAKENRLSLSDTNLRMEKKGASTELVAEGGVFEFSDQPQAKLTDARARLSQDTLYLTQAQGRLGEAGKISASGNFGVTSELRLQCTGIDVRKVIPEDWKDHVKGELSGETDLAWGADRALRSKGKFLLTEGLLERLELLDQIASFTSSPQFRRMPLQEVSGSFLSEGSTWEVTDFKLESKGLLRAEGTFQVSEGGLLAGTFRIGVSPQVLQWIPGSRERVFTVNERGYVWTDLKVGGTLENPTEDLSSRLAAAAAGEIIDRGTRAVTDPTGTAVDTARDLLDSLSPLLR